MVRQVLPQSLRCVRKNKTIGQTFGSGFSWSEAVDAAADVYNGVSETGSPSLVIDANDCLSMCSGHCLPRLGLQSGVSWLTCGPETKMTQTCRLSALAHGYIRL